MLTARGREVGSSPATGLPENQSESSNIEGSSTKTLMPQPQDGGHTLLERLSIVCTPRDEAGRSMKNEPTARPHQSILNEMLATLLLTQETDLLKSEIT